MYLYLNHRYGSVDWVVSAACPNKAGAAGAGHRVVLGCPPFILAASVPPGAPAGAWAAPDQLPFLSQSRGHGWAMPDTAHTQDFNANYGKGPRRVPSLHAVCLHRGVASSLNAVVPTRPPYWRMPRGCAGGGCTRRRRRCTERGCTLFADKAKLRRHERPMMMPLLLAQLRGLAAAQRGAGLGARFKR